MSEIKETRINGKYIIGQKIGSGSFGDIFIAYNADKPSEIVAVKLVE